jgi:chorismate dehydratase
VHTRIASVGYLNARPLTEHLDSDTYALTRDIPARIAALLAAGEVDVALVPVAAALCTPGLRVVPGLCIGARGPVSSVLLVAETPPEQWERLVLDGESRTSAALTRLMLARGPLKGRVPASLSVESIPPGAGVEAARGTTAALVIGDAARELPARLTVRLDLAELWTEWTGHPFVFAVWAGRADLPASVVRDIRVAGERGLAERNERYSGDDLHYVTENIRYRLDDAALIGLRRFAALAHAEGLVDASELELYGPGSPVVPRVDTDALLARAADGEDVGRDGWMALANDARLADLCAAAHLRRREAHPGDVVEWWATARIAGARDDLAERVAEAVAFGATRIQVLGPCTSVASLAATHPGVRFETESVVEGATALLPDTAGISSDRIRTALGVEPWAQVAERWHAARAAGFAVEGGLAVGQGESVAERVDHLLRLRAAHTEIGLDGVRVWAAFLPGAAAASDANTAEDHLRYTALARLIIGGRMVASPSTEGLGMAQVSLRGGCDSLGAVILEGDRQRWPRLVEQAQNFVLGAGFRPHWEGTAAPTVARGRGGPVRRTLQPGA